MSEYKFVNVDETKNAQDYIVNMVGLTVSLATLARLNLHTLKLGIFDSDQEELANTIVWECKRIGQYMQKMVDGLSETHQVDIDKVIKKLQKSAPKPAEKPKKTVKKTARKAK